MTLSPQDQITPANASSVQYALKLLVAAQHDGEDITLASVLATAEAVVPVDYQNEQPRPVRAPSVPSLNPVSINPAQRHLSRERRD